MQKSQTEKEPKTFKDKLIKLLALLMVILGILGALWSYYQPEIVGWTANQLTTQHPSQMGKLLRHLEGEPDHKDKPTDTVKQMVQTNQQAATGQLPQSGVQYDNSGLSAAVTSLNALNKQRQAPGRLLKRGYIAIPQQPGMQAPVNTLAIHEGTSAKVLAYGAGTAKPNEKAGHNNYALSAHNFGDQVTMFSPLQFMDANQQPLIYLFDGKKIYTYKVNKQTDKVPGWRKVTWQHGEVVQDDAESQKKPAITLTTCYMTGSGDLHPVYRVIVRGTLVKSESFNSAPQAAQALFE